MKLLIFLILTFGQMFGQDLNDETMTYGELSAIMGWEDSCDNQTLEDFIMHHTFEYEPCDDPTCLVWHGTMVLTPPPLWERPTFREQFSELLQDYSEECYVDTTWIIKEYYDSSLFDNYESCGYDDKYYYLRRKPTFPGLMEWLNDLSD